MAKLTLKLDDVVVERARQHAARQGTSVSRLVETYLGLLAWPERISREELPPITRRLAGALEGAGRDREAYRRHLERKYR